MLFLHKCLLEMYFALENLENVHVLPIRLCNHTNSALLSYRTYSNTYTPTPKITIYRKYSNTASQKNQDLCTRSGQNVIYQQDLGILNPRIEDP